MRRLSLLASAVLLLSAAPPARAQQAVVRAEAQSGTLDCGGGDARVEGNRNRLTFRGACRALELFGNANTVQVELAPGARVRVEGQDNRILYTVARGGAAPQVVVAGVNSLVAPAGTMAAPTPPPTPAQPPPATALAPSGASAEPPAERLSVPLAIRGDDQQREADCAGRDVVIEGSRGSYVLRGGCRSLRVTGTLATVRVELQPGARVQIEGGGITVHWRLATPGNPPLVAIRGEGSRAVRAGPRGY